MYLDSYFSGVCVCVFSENVNRTVFICCVLIFKRMFTNRDGAFSLVQSSGFFFGADRVCEGQVSGINLIQCGQHHYLILDD